MEIRNFTGGLARGEAFLRAKAALADTTSLDVHIKFTKARGRDINGYYRWADQRMVLAVKQRLRYPRVAAYGVGTTPRSDRRLGGLPYRLVWHEERFESADDLFVFVAGHEFWHYLCHTGQRKRDHETKANCNGFAWLREFRDWSGAEVEEIPLVPPRPDRIQIAEVVAVAEIADLVADPVAMPPAAVEPASKRTSSRSARILDAARQLLLFH